jgi:hypothetical protein
VRSRDPAPAVLVGILLLVVIALALLVTLIALYRRYRS